LGTCCGKVASILARAYGIPAVVGAKGLLAALADRDPTAALLVDGASGEIVIAPDDADIARFVELHATIKQTRARDRDEAALPAETRDGTTVTLLANIGSPAEAPAAVALGAKGVGLFRTEFLFLERADPPQFLGVRALRLRD
jgi:phosphoenolpyruvate-protein phosphotransferase (PTS system enzyme I)